MSTARVCRSVTFVSIALLALACERADPEPLERPLIVGDLQVCELPFAEYFDPDVMRAPGPDADHVVHERDEIGGAVIRALGAGVGGAFVDMTASMEEWGYRVCHARDVGGILFVPPAGAGLPVMAWRPGPARPFIVEVPHPFNEIRTREQGLEAFTEFGARAVIVNGAHRCAGRQVMGCSGRSTVCEGGYRDTDPAHNPDTVFHAMHVGLTELYHQHYAISLHGLSHDHVVVSDGTEFGAGDGTPAAEAARILDDLLGEHTEVRSCNNVRGVAGTDEYCGTTNVQGRHLNRSPDTCSESADFTTHRFVHLEQPRRIRDDDRTRRAVMHRLFDALDPAGRHDHDGHRH